MKTKVVRSGDKNFEEEKVKMFDPGLTKEKQLRLVFYAILSTVIEKVDNGYNALVGNKEMTNEYVEQLIKEVKIRTKL